MSFRRWSIRACHLYLRSRVSRNANTNSFLVQFAEYIQANIALYTTRNAYTLSPASIAAFVRNELARSLRSRNPYTVNLLLGGVDVPTDPLNTSPQSNPTTGPSTTTGGTSNTTSGTTTTSTTTSTGDTNAPAVQAIDSAAAKDSEKKVKPRLYWLDYLASCAPVPYAAHGYAQYYCLSILDKHHHPDIDLETGMKLLRMCSDELKRRLPIDFKGLTVKVVDGKGVREVEFEESVGVKSA